MQPLSGRYRLGEFCELIDSLDLFPVAPQRDVSRLYRVWAFHSAALDLALRQAAVPLFEALRRVPSSMRYVCSLRLGEPPTLEPVQLRLALDPTLRFKLDATSSWTPELIEGLIATGAVDSIDFKALYRGTIVDQDADPTLYARVVEAFPDAWLEDPDVVAPATAEVLAAHHDRITWDANIHSIADIEGLPFPPTDGQHQTVADRRVGKAVRHLRLLRGVRNRCLRRWADRTGTRAWAGAVPCIGRSILTRRMISRRRPTTRAAAGRSALESAGPELRRHRLQMGAETERVARDRGFGNDRVRACRSRVMSWRRRVVGTLRGLGDPCADVDREDQLEDGQTPAPIPSASGSRPTWMRCSTRSYMVEASSRTMAARRRCWPSLRAARCERTVIATTTSSLSIHELAAATGRPERFAGLHVFIPVPQMELVELVFPHDASEENA